MNITIRKFQKSDAEETAKLIHTTLRISNSCDYTKEYLENTIASLSPKALIDRAEYAHMYVAADHEKIVGCGAIAGYWGSETESILLNIFVHPEYQKKGIGRKIIEILENDEYAQRADRIEIPASITACKFYQKMGYTYKNGIRTTDEEGLFRLEKFRTKNDRLIAKWKAEEDIAHIHGWDFSHIDGRYEEETDLPWNYKERILSYLTPDRKLLDIDTGGGEFLLSLGHPYENTSATENYPPNITLCEKTLLPLGIDFRAADGKGALPFADASFDMVIDRHGDFCAEEIFRVLKEDGLFITQQVGAENDRELVSLLLGKETPLPFPEQYLNITSEKFRKAGFEILDEQEAFRAIRFFDIGALVWFARIIAWEFPRFSVDFCLEKLLFAQKKLEKNGFLEGKTHRFMLVAKKKSILG